ncbi:hypothetical protein E8E14_004244 [Neopestalotiopsis sp. 37M]|nr:hypothetical protein E8E14_004244 [Neopestalotiopsis sp. 37M]
MSGDNEQRATINDHLKTVAPLYGQPLEATRTFNSLAGQWAKARSRFRHDLDLFTSMFQDEMRDNIESRPLDSSLIMTANLLRITPSIECYETKGGGSIIVIEFQIGASMIHKSGQSDHENRLGKLFDEYVRTFVEDDCHAGCQNKEHSKELSTQLALLQFYRTGLRLYTNFLALIEVYDRQRKHRVDPRFATLPPSILADVITDAYYYNMFLEVATATSTTLKSLVGIVRASTEDLPEPRGIKCLLAETEAYSDSLSILPAQMADRLARHVELINMSRNIQESTNSRILNLLACVFLPLSMATSLLSMSTRLVNLGPLLYDFCGVVILFASVLIVIVLLLKVVQRLGEEIRKPSGDDSFRRLIQDCFKALKPWLWVNLLVIWSVILASFIVGMVVDIGLGFRILGYGLAAFVGVVGVSLSPFLVLYLFSVTC